MEALVLIANGSEEMETVITIDVLRRAGITTTVLSLNEEIVLCSRGVKLVADTTTIPSKVYDCIILPSGLEGAKTFASDKRVGELLKRHLNKLICVICASPIALEAHQIHINSKITCHFSVKDQLKSYTYVDDRVVCDKMITSQGPGTALEFALAIVEKLLGVEKSREISKPMMI